MRCLRVLFGTFLGVQWLRLHIPVQGAWFDPLSGNEELRSHMWGGGRRGLKIWQKKKKRECVGGMDYFKFLQLFCHNCFFAYSSRDLALFLFFFFFFFSYFLLTCFCGNMEFQGFKVEAFLFPKIAVIYSKNICRDRWNHHRNIWSLCNPIGCHHNLSL